MFISPLFTSLVTILWYGVLFIPIVLREIGVLSLIEAETLEKILFILAS